MKIKMITIGKTSDDYLREGVKKYVDRLKHYVNFEVIEISSLKMSHKNNTEVQKEKEGRELLKNIVESDFVVLLDEKGLEKTSSGFSGFIQKRMNTGINLIFVIGGPYGFSNDVYQRANIKMALSQMTFSHQMVRLFFIEQLYRAFTILKGEKYHHK